jgi:hypothetical protein
MTARYPLTFQQQWVWSLLQDHPLWKAEITNGFRVRGPLRPEVLERSLAEVVQRHAALRTRFVLDDGMARQQVDDVGSFELECVEVPGTSPAVIEENARSLLVEFSELRMDVARGPLFRAQLLCLGARDHWLLLCVHRLVGECFSGEQISAEVFTLYTDFLQERASTLNATPLQYYDYALQQQGAAADWAGKHESYWTKRLETARNLEWRVEQSVQGVARGTLGRMSIHLGESLSTELRELARRERVLLATVMLAIYVAALWRCCQQPDFVVPFFVAGRKAEHKSAIGYFSHILYLCIDLGGVARFGDLLKAVGNEFFRALTHQDFGRMALQTPRLLEGNFFQWLTWYSSGAQTLPTSAPGEEADLTVERVAAVDFAEDLTALPPGVVSVELTCFDTSSGIYASGVYRADLYTQRAMDEFLHEFQAVAEQVVGNPQAPIAVRS